MSDRIGISLGWNCYSATKAVEMGIRSRKANGYMTCPFDEALTNYHGIVECIKDDFNHFFDLELFEVPNTSPYCSGDTLIRNTKYNFVFNHESPGHANLWQTEGWPGGREHFISNSYKNFKERYEKRIQNFKSYLLSGKEITFILTRPTPIDTAELDNVLKDKYPSLSYSIVYLDLQKDVEHYVDHLRIMGFSDTHEEIQRLNINIHNKMSAPVFYVAHYPNSELACKMLSICVESIQKYYPDSDCWVLYTPSKYPVNLPKSDKLHVEETPVLNSSVIGGFQKYIYSGETRKAIFLHDSIFLKGHFSSMLDSPFGFLWHFLKQKDKYTFETTHYKEEITNILNTNIYWVGCFGCCVFSDRPSLIKLWNSIDFVSFANHPKRSLVLMDLERVIGIYAYSLGLIPQNTTNSLCGNIYDMPNSFTEWYTGQDLNEIEKIQYTQAAIKTWCRRAIKDSVQ
jgi:hypothetical protein